MNSNAFSAADMTTAAASGHRDGYQAGYADAVKAVEVSKAAAAQEASAIEQIAQQWDGCMYDGVGETINIGEAIRAAGKRLLSQPAAAQKAVAVWTVTREGDPTFPRAYFSEAAADAMVAHITLAPFAVKRAPVAAAPVDDGMLPDALVPYSKEWYTLCERRFAVDKIKISGDLACAIVDAICARPTSTPAAPGIDLEQFREAVEHWKRDLHDDYKGGHIHDGGEAMRKAEHLLALIDASPKGGSEAESRFAFCAKHETFPIRTEDGRNWIMFVAADPAYPNIRAAHVAATPEAAIDAAMQATSAEVGECNCANGRAECMPDCASKQPTSHGAGVSE